VHARGKRCRNRAPLSEHGFVCVKHLRKVFQLSLVELLGKTKTTALKHNEAVANTTQVILQYVRQGKSIPELVRDQLLKAEEEALLQQKDVEYLTAIYQGKALNSSEDY
jgi:urease gamma subunit